jgi:predicted O-methyltransferase YrrM
MDIDRLIRRRFRMHGEQGGTNGESYYPRIANRGGRERLVQLFAELGYKEGVEVGTSIGKFARYMLETVPGLHLMCVDPYAEYSWATQDRQDDAYRRVQENLAGLNVTILRQTSMEAVRNVRDGSIDFVYIDADHLFDPFMCDLIMWSNKVRAGGIVAGHDYIYYPPITRAVDAYVSCHSTIGPWYLVREAWGGVAGGGGTFFWVKR